MPNYHLIPHKPLALLVMLTLLAAVVLAGVFETGSGPHPLFAGLPPTTTPTVTPTPTSTPTPTPTSAPVTLRVSPVGQTIDAGMLASVDIVVDNAYHLGAFQFTLSFDGALVAYQSATYGPFLGSTNRTPVCQAPAVGAGSVTFICVSLGSPPPDGPNGTGVLLTAVVTGLLGGTSPLHLSNALVSDTSAMPEQPLLLLDGSITVNVPTPTPTPCAPTCTPTPTNTPTDTPTVTPTTTPTPCPDFDGDTICDSVDPDIDGDGCPNVNELQTAVGSELTGGKRNPAYYYDYGDMPIVGSIPLRDKQVRVNDILAVVQRYFANDAGGTASINRNSDPLSAPPATGYHPAYDRGAQVGANPWNAAPPDGQILVADILYVVKQYFHDCA